MQLGRQLTFFLAVEALHGRLVRAFSRRMALLVTDTTGSGEDTRVGAVRLVVSAIASASINGVVRANVYPSSPQLKHLPGPSGSVGHSRALWPASPHLPYTLE